MDGDWDKRKGKGKRREAEEREKRKGERTIKDNSHLKLMKFETLS